MKVQKPKLSGPTAYLGRFQKEKHLCRGHNSYDDKERESVIEQEKKNLRTIENDTRKADNRAYGFEGRTVKEIREEYHEVQRARRVPVKPKK